MYLSKTDIQQSLQNGTIFDDFTVRMDNKYTKRRKQVIKTSAEGTFYIHECYNCHFGKYAPRNVLRIAHIRRNVRYNDSTELTYTLQRYTKDMKLILSILS